MNDSKTPRHFLSLLDLSSDELRTLIARASELISAYFGLGNKRNLSTTEPWG